MGYEENERIELKRQMVDGLDKEIVAFLNTRGGTIYIGVDDDGKIVGVPENLRDEYDNHLSNILSANIKPNPRSRVSFYYNEESVLVIEIKEGDSKPYYLSSKGIRPSGIYIRVGRSKRQADDNEILTMIRDSSGWLWEKEISPVQDLTFKTMGIYFESRKLEFDRRDYLTLGLVNREGKFTNLALLLSEESPVQVKFASYDEKLNFLVKKEFVGSILKIADQALEYADMMNTTTAVILPYQAQRVETQSFPGVSLREAILNAICHADYSFPSNIKIEFFYDKAQISNPGNIYRYSLEEVLKGQQSFRNPGLVRVLYMLGFIENYGKGLRRINEAYAGKSRQPSFENLKNSFITYLPNLNFSGNRFDADGDTNDTRETIPSPHVPQNSGSVPQNVPQKSVDVPQNSSKDCADDLSKIIDAIEQDDGVSREELARIIGKSTKTVSRLIKKSTMIKYVGPSKGGHWEIEEKK